MEIGDRVASSKDGAHGTIKWLGCLADRPGRWVGVDWDAPDRGHHDGTLAGVRYFHARCAKSGSFVKEPSLVYGQDLLTILLDQYTDDQEASSRWAGKDVVFCDNAQAEMRRRVQLKRVFALDGLPISRSPATCEIFSAATELNLSNTLLNRWQELIALLRYFPNVRTLDVSRNRFQDCAIPAENYGASVEELAVNDCGLSAKQLASLPAVFPRLRRFFAESNGISEATFRDGDLSFMLQMEHLVLSYNPIRRIAALAAQQFKVHYLQLCGCDIASIDVLQDSVGSFSTVQKLIIKENALDWSSVAAMSAMPSLISLCVDEIQPAEHYQGMDCREVIIALLPTLTELNMSEISYVERRSAELRFLTRFNSSAANDTLSPPFERDAGERLRKVYGTCVPSATAPVVSGVRTVTLQFQLGDRRTSNRTVPVAMNVGRLRMLVARQLSVSVGSIEKLTLVQKGGTHRIVLDDEIRALANYTPQHNDLVEVEVV